MSVMSTQLLPWKKTQYVISLEVLHISPWLLKAYSCLPCHKLKIKHSAIFSKKSSTALQNYKSWESKGTCPRWISPQNKNRYIFIQSILCHFYPAQMEIEQATQNIMVSKSWVHWGDCIYPPQYSETVSEWNLNEIPKYRYAALKQLCITQNSYG